MVKIKNTIGPALVNLTVGISGSGSVTSSPAGINCGSVCVASVTPGTMITLTALTSGGSSFAGWNGGGCAGTGACVVTVNAATTVTATFTGGTATLLAVLSRKAHGTAGTFDLPILMNIPIAGAITVEPRTIGAGHTIVFQFDQLITSAGPVTATLGSATSVTSNNNDVIVTLTGLAENRRVTISLTNVNGSASSAAVSMGFSVGDVNNTRSVNSSDISGVKARSGQTTTASNFQFDLNASGAINSSDISAVKARSGLTLP